MEIFKRQIPRSIIFKSICGANFSRQTPSIVRHRYFNYQGQKTKVEKREIVITNQIKSKTHVTWILCTTGIPLKLMEEGNWMLLAVCVLLRQFLKVQLISKNKVYEIVVMLHFFFVAIHYFFT